MNSPSQSGDRIESSPKHQPDQVNARGVFGVGLALAALVLLSMVGMVAFFRGLAVPDNYLLPDYATVGEDMEPPPPKLDPFQSQHLRQLRAEQQRILTSYEWIDREAGIARIPIARAMEMLHHQLPARNHRD